MVAASVVCVLPNAGVMNGGSTGSEACRLVRLVNNFAVDHVCLVPAAWGEIEVVVQFLKHDVESNL